MLTVHNTELEFWSERDRLHVGLRNHNDAYIFSAWDDDARALFDDGFLSHRGTTGLHGSVVEYCNSLGIAPDHCECADCRPSPSDYNH